MQRLVSPHFQLACSIPIIGMYLGENNDHPDELASFSKPADLDLHGFQNMIHAGSAWLRLIFYLDTEYFVNS